MSKHTPGPWKVGKTSGWSGTEVKAIASIAWCAKASSYSSSWGDSQEISADEALANAHLVAAAPDLLDALEEYHRVANAVPYAQWTPAMHKAQDAIAKAKGKKP